MTVKMRILTMTDTSVTAVKKLVRTILHFCEDFANGMDSHYNFNTRDHTKSRRKSYSNGMICWIRQLTPSHEPRTTSL